MSDDYIGFDEERYQQEREVALAGALWPSSFSGVMDERGRFVPMLRFAEPPDFSRWPEEQDLECAFMWHLIGGALADPEKAEMIGLLVIEWPEEQLGYRFAIDLQTTMRRLFPAIRMAGMQMMATADPKGVFDTSVGITLEDTEEFRALEAFAELIESRPELWKEKDAT